MCFFEKFPRLYSALGAWIVENLIKNIRCDQRSVNVTKLFQEIDRQLVEFPLNPRASIYELEEQEIPHFYQFLN